MFWTVHKHERDHKAAAVLKLLILSVGFAAILKPILGRLEVRRLAAAVFAMLTYII